jgi:manganese-dependent inorganic pyrophosphatase
MVGAAATLIAEKFEKDGLTPSPASGLLLYAAIASNTLAFKAAVTTDRDKRMADWLNATLKTDPHFVRDFFKAKSQLDGEALYARIASDFARFQFGGESIGIAQIEMVGAQQLIDTRSEEILVVIQQLGKEFDLDHTFISLVDVEEEATFMLSMSAKTRDLVGRALGLSFEANPLRRPGLILRKEITPLLRQQLEPQP